MNAHRLPLPTLVLLRGARSSRSYIYVTPCHVILGSKVSAFSSISELLARLSGRFMGVVDYLANFCDFSLPKHRHKKKKQLQVQLFCILSSLLLFSLIFLWAWLLFIDHYFWWTIFGIRSICEPRLWKSKWKSTVKAARERWRNLSKEWRVINFH